MRLREDTRRSLLLLHAEALAEHARRSALPQGLARIGVRRDAEGRPDPQDPPMDRRDWGHLETQVQIRAWIKALRGGH